MIGLSTTSTALVIHEEASSSMKKMPGRVSRSATLDGGAVIVPGGFSHGDRTLSVAAKLTETEIATLTSMHQEGTTVGISLPDGYFSGAISYLSADVWPVEFTVLLKEKLSS